METLQVKRQQFMRYYQMYLETPDTKLLYHFPTHTIMIAKIEFQTKRVIPLKVVQNNGILSITAENHNETYNVVLI